MTILKYIFKYKIIFKLLLIDHLFLKLLLLQQKKKMLGERIIWLVRYKEGAVLADYNLEFRQQASLQSAGREIKAQDLARIA